MITNFEISPAKLGFDRSMKVFKRASWPIEGAAKRRSRFVSSQDKRRKERARARKSAFLSKNNPHPLSLCVMQMKEGEVAHELKIPVMQRGLLARDLGQIRTPVPVVVGGRSEAALTIVEFDSHPPEVVVLKDEGKDLLRFPFGMRDPEDSTLFVNARRECQEEAFWELDISLPEFTENNSLGIISVSADHSVGVFHIVLPADTPINPGEEQEAAFRVPIDLVDKYVARGLFSQTHCIAWELFKKKIPLLRARAG